MMISPHLCLAALMLTGSSPHGVPVSYMPLPSLPPKKEKPKAEEDPTRTTERARQALTEFAKATTVEEMAKHVRHPKTALPRMKAHYDKSKPRPLALKFSSDWIEIDKQNHTLVATAITLDFKETYAVVEVPTNDGPALVDWESFVGWCEMPWADFVKKGTEKAKEFRVAVSLSDYYNFNYQDSKKYVAFRLVDKDDTETLYAYCEANSRTCKEILAHLREARSESKDRPAEDVVRTFILNLSMKGDDVARHQALIEGVVHPGWVTP